MRWVVLVVAACGQPPAPIKRVTTTETPHVEPGRPARIELQSSAGFDRGLDVAFDNAPPSFAYVKNDEVLVFDYDRSAIDGAPRRSSFVRYQLGHGKALENLPIVDDELWRAWVEPPSAATLATLHKRAAEIGARVRGMEPLSRISDWVDVPGGATKKVSFGRVTVTARFTATFAMALEVTRDGKRLGGGEVKQFDTKQTHQEDEATLPCTYDPNAFAVYSDGERAGGRAVPLLDRLRRPRSRREAVVAQVIQLAGSSIRCASSLSDCAQYRPSSTRSSKV